MSIDFTGHCAYPIEEAHARIAYLRRTRPDWFFDMMHLTDAHDLGPFGHEIAEEFGIDAKCAFSLHLLNSDWVEHTGPAVEYIYQVFGTERLVITYGTDSIRKPEREYVAMKVDLLI